MTYGNGAYVDYTYDLFGRVTKEAHSDGTDYYYFYDTEDRLTRQAKVVDDVVKDVYTFEYDSLGRLIRSKQTDGGTLGTNTVSEGDTVQRTEHLYDEENRITSQTWQLGTETYSESYTYNDNVSSNTSGVKDGSIATMTVNPMGKTLAFTYDSLKHLDTVALPGIYTRDYTYKALSSLQSTNLVSRVSYTANNNTKFEDLYYDYTYDAAGNITQIKENGTVIASYAYDKQGQMYSETRDGITYLYTYDTAGNILSVSSEGIYPVDVYTYGNANWHDQLTGITYNGTHKDISYDAIGNPTNWYNGHTLTNMTWSKGRQLTSLTKNGSTAISYTYDMNGIRDSKTVGDTTYKYLTQNGQVVRQSWAAKILDIVYDNNSQPLGLRYSKDSGETFTNYYFVLNAQGDVVRLVNKNGATVANYAYDAWGAVTVTSATGESLATSHIGNINPIRYRGYFYDRDTKLYYLQSRYYDPQVGRFVNADNPCVSVAASYSLADTNLYAYCSNNPVSRCDEDGEFWNIAAGAVIGAAINAATQILDNALTGRKLTDGLVAAAVGGAITGGFAASGAGKIVQGLVSGVVAAGSEYINQKKVGGKLNYAKIIGSGLIGLASGIAGGDGVHHKKGAVAKAKHLYDYVKGGIKQRKWTSSRANTFLRLSSKKYLQTYDRVLRKTTAVYTATTVGSTALKELMYTVW